MIVGILVAVVVGLAAAVCIKVIIQEANEL